MKQRDLVSQSVIMATSSGSPIIFLGQSELALEDPPKKIFLGTTNILSSDISQLSEKHLWETSGFNRGQNLPSLLKAQPTDTST